jgi:rubrerythrin
MKVLRFAEEVDRSARRFYEEMAARTDNPGVKRIFTMLAEDEEQLLRRHRMLTARGDALDAEALDDGVNVFERLRRREEQLAVADDVAAYRLALEAERDMARQYREAARTEIHPDVRKLLVKIARDEERHIEELEQLYTFTSAPDQFLAWGEFSNLGEFHNFGRDVDR